MTVEQGRRPDLTAEHPGRMHGEGARQPTAPGDGRGLRIGEAAAVIGVSPSALRLWERQGLVRPARTSGRYRLYSPDDLEALRRVKQLRSVHKVNAPGIRRLLGGTSRGARGTAGLDGTRLRELRLRKRLSLRQAAAASDLSVSFISSLERGASGGSVSALQRLTSAYGATLLDLFPDGGASGRLVRPADRRVLTLAGSETRIEQLASGGVMEPQLFVLAPRASSEGAYAHDGEEFMFVFEGALNVWLGDDEEYRLRAGDALYFPSTTPHRWHNASSRETRLLWINTPPTF